MSNEVVGYARVSTDEQNLALQLDALEQAGCRRVFDDVGSGSLKHRPQLDACLKFLAAGDTLVVWRQTSHRARRTAVRLRDRVPLADRADRHHHPVT